MPPSVRAHADDRHHPHGADDLRCGHRLHRLAPHAVRQPGTQDRDHRVDRLHRRERAAAHLRRPRAQQHGSVCAHRRVLVQLSVAARRVPALPDHALEIEVIDMTITQPQTRLSFWDTYRRRRYFFREAAILTISLGVLIHLYRVIFGDDMTMRHVMTPTADRILLVPMTYAAITGILLLVQNRVRFANKRHRVLFTGSVVYIAGSVPLHIYCSYIIVDNTLMTWFPMWFSYFLLVLVYPAFLTMFWRLQYKN